MTHNDPVTPELHAEVLMRDGGCMAPHLGATDACRDRWGNDQPTEFELDHVKDQPRMGKRAPSDADHLVTLCHHHHQGGWATANRPLLRSYLRHVEADPFHRAWRSAALALSEVTP